RSSNRDVSGPASMVSAAGSEAIVSNEFEGVTTWLLCHTTATVVTPTTSNSDKAHAIAGRMAQPVQRRTAVSRWMDLDSKRSRTEERNCIQSGSGISSSIELTSVLTSA